MAPRAMLNLNLEVRPEGERDLDAQTIWIHLTEDQAEAMASGYVPRAVKSILRELLDSELEDQRRADRPVIVTKKPKVRPSSASETCEPLAIGSSA